MLANPRTAHLVGATYQHRWQNWLILPRTLLFCLVALALIMLFSFLFGRFRRRVLGRVLP